MKQTPLFISSQYQVPHFFFWVLLPLYSHFNYLTATAIISQLEYPYKLITSSLIPVSPHYNTLHTYFKLTLFIPRFHVTPSPQFLDGFLFFNISNLTLAFKAPYIATV